MSWPAITALGLAALVAIGALVLAGWIWRNEQDRDQTHHIDPEGNVHVLFSPHVDRDLKRHRKELPPHEHNVAT